MKRAVTDRERNLNSSHVSNYRDRLAQQLHFTEQAAQDKLHQLPGVFQQVTAKPDLESRSPVSVPFSSSVLPLT